MDLHSGESVWDPCPILCDQEQEIPSNNDIIIIGMGISGALLAHRLSHEGVGLTLIDSRHAAAGSTSASTAIIQYELDQPLWKLRKEMRPQDAEFVYHKSLAAVRELGHVSAGMFEDVEQAEQFRHRPSIQLAYSLSETADLRREFSARRQAGFDMEWLTADELRSEYGLVALAATRNHDGADLDPVMFASSLLRYAQRRGAQLFENTPVTSIAEASNGVTLQLKSGRKIRCQHLIVAAGYETKSLLRLQVSKLNSSYAGATGPGLSAKLLPHGLLIWEVARPYHYMRTTTDGRIIIGGRDKPFRNAFLRDLLMPYEKYRLTQKARRMLHSDDLTLKTFWSGTFAESEDGMPFIGPLPGHQRTFAVLGCGGNGTTFAAMARQLAVDWLRGRTGRLQKIVGFERNDLTADTRNHTNNILARKSLTRSA